MKDYIRALSPRLEFAIVVGGAFGFFILGSVIAVFNANGSPKISDGHLQSLIAYELVVAIVLLAFLRVRQWRLQSFGINPSLAETFVGGGLAIAAYLTCVVVFAISAGLFPSVAEAAANQTLVAPGLSFALVVAISIVNPVFEEVFVCGYVISALKQRCSFWTAINVSIAIRLSYHLYQGPVGVISIIPIGFIFAYWYARTGRLWPLIVAHAMIDLMGLLAYT